MSKLPQGFCFPADLKEKLQDPELALEDWKVRVLEEEIALKVKPSASKKGKGFSIIYSDKNGIGHEVARSKADFVQLEKYLVSRFPGSVVPPFPKGNPSLYGTFLQTVADNPFYRSDASFRAFLDGGTEKYRKKKLKDETKRKSRGREGMLRWLQALNEYPDQTKLIRNSTKLSTVKVEFEQLYKNISTLSKSMTTYVQKLNELSRASKVMEQSMTAVLAGEKNYVDIKGEALGSYGELGDILHETVNLSMKQAGISAKEYGAAMFARRIADPLLYEVLTVANWRKSINLVAKKQDAFLKAQKAVETQRGTAQGEDKGSMKIEKSEETEKVTYIEFFKQVQGTMGVSLEEYRTKRTEKVKQMYDNMSQFHLLGATKISEVWNPKGNKEVEWSIIDDDLEESFLDERRSSQRLSMSSAFFRSSSTRQTLTADKTVTLKVVKSFVSKKAKFLSLEEGEILTAQRHNEETWLAINKKGKQGFVASEYVVVGNQSGVPELDPTPKKKQSIPPGLLLAPPGLGGDDDGDSDSDFEFDGDSHVSHGSSQARKRGVIPQTLTRPGPPGGGSTVQRGGQRPAGTANVPRARNIGTPANMLRQPPKLPVNPLVAALKQNPNIKSNLKAVGSTESEKTPRKNTVTHRNAQAPQSLLGELTQTLQNRRESVHKDDQE